jgi:pSer/pThr/pTyr-binding forkhead associated (FHA) protein
MLFLPPKPPVRLVPGQPCVLGRSPSCDLPIPSSGASRRHAHVCWEKDGIVIRDLSTTNGTFVNGEKLSGPRTLRAGDRIMIGDRTITFCQVDGALAGEGDAPGDSDTVAFASSGAVALGDADAFQGNLAEIPAFAVVQMLEMGMKTGLLEISRGEDHQRIWFHCGMPFHAVAGGKDGDEAAFAIVRPLDGRFVFRPSEPCPTRTIHKSVAEILLEASRRMDEDKR